jgi:hypothetical protein
MVDRDKFKAQTRAWHLALSSALCIQQRLHESSTEAYKELIAFPCIVLNAVMSQVLKMSEELSRKPR